MGSRSLQLGGSAIHEAAGEVIERALPIAARLLDTDVHEIRFDPTTGRFSGPDGSAAAGVGWVEVAGTSQFDGAPLAAAVDFTAESPPYPFGAHLAVLAVANQTRRDRQSGAWGDSWTR